jgi:hypothetical protein
MVFMFRVYMYASISGDFLKSTTFNSVPLGTWQAADDYLMLAHRSGFACGGGIEQFVEGIGWVVRNEQPEESEGAK